jgi:ATP-dependent 26S proteasome regulatory subunit
MLRSCCVTRTLNMRDLNPHAGPAEVIQPEDAGAGFRDVGALAGPKAALREAVQLPLQHPALFSRGPLARPCRGVLLFGPPGEAFL